MNKDKQHQKMVKNSKRLGYAGLATITLVSGMGATPVILADENFAASIVGLSIFKKKYKL